MGTRKILREREQAIQSRGITIDDTKFSGSGHMKYFLSYKGHKRVVMSSCSPSDGNSQSAFERDLDRWLDNL